MKIFNLKQNKAFTLVETLVAISIFTVALIALMGVLSKGITNTTYSKKAQTASYLAQEGIEYMRNIRDTYVLYYSTIPQSGWDAFNTNLSSKSCTGFNGCYFNADSVFSYSQPMQMTQITIAPCSNSNCSDHPMLYNSANGSFGYTTGSASGFSRQITVTQVGSPVTEVKVTSTVYWNQGSGGYSTSLSEDLFNWAE